MRRGAPTRSRAWPLRLRRPGAASRSRSDGDARRNRSGQRWVAISACTLRASNRAGEGNRNPAVALATRCSTFELHLHGERILGIEPSAAQLGRLAPHHEDTRKWPSLSAPPRRAGASTSPRDYRTCSQQVPSGPPEPMFGIEPKPPRYERGARPSCSMGRRTAAQLGRGATSVEMLGNAPSRSACKANQQLLHSSPLIDAARVEIHRRPQRQGAEESNLILRIWDPLGHHGPHPVALRTRIELVPLLGQRSCDTSRITKQESAPGASRTQSLCLGGSAPDPRSRAGG
jgi:hypothetical protein